MAPFRRYYPGFWGAAFLVLLRIAIGWHLLSEGIYKIMSTPEGKTHLSRYFKKTTGPVFTSEGYQRNASGPFAENFRNLIPDVESRDALDFAKLKDAWSAEMHKIGNHFAFDAEQQAAASKELAAREKVAEVWFNDPENAEKIRKYKDELDEIKKESERRDPMSYEVERNDDRRKSVEKDRRTLIAPIDTWTKALRDAWVNLATDKQEAEAGDYGAAWSEWSEVKKADYVTMYGLTICGVCLILGLFTPVAALGASAFLMLFYISMPPWPGLPEPANAEGHYVFVNKNLIEFIALLALAATPNGLWLGIDAFLFGWIDRLRARRALAREARPAHEPSPGGSTVKIRSQSKSR